MTSTTGRKDHEFSSKTKRTIAERAAFQCVVPGCTEVTSGPGATSDKVALLGTACHIYSAGENGPRGRSTLTPAEISAPSNGVWACANHGRLIDTNKGQAYPAALLKGWKKLQEARLKKAQDHQRTQIGWLDHICVQNSFLFAPDATLTLGKATLLQGGPLGKTALCDWITTALGDQESDRWAIVTPQTLVRVEAYVPEQTCIEVALGKPSLDVKVNGLSSAETPKTMAVVYLREGEAARIGMLDADDDERIGSALRVDGSTIRRLVADIQRVGTPWSRDLAFHIEPKYLGEDEQGESEFSEDETEARLRRQGVTFGAFSGSEKLRVLLDFACALARDRVKRHPTLLVLDASDWAMDQKNMQRCGAYLSAQPFQTLMTFRGGWEPEDPTYFEQWNRVVLKSKKSGLSEIAPAPWPIVAT